MPIDLFFQSLAEDRRDKAIGVVLSGSASDGALGIKAIKGEGGVTFAQDPDTAKHDGMPRSAIASGAVDFVLPPRDIALELARLGRHPYLSDPVEPDIEAETTDGRALNHIYRMLQQETGVDFRLYRQTTIQRRIARRRLVHKIDHTRTDTSITSKSTGPSCRCSTTKSSSKSPDSSAIRGVRGPAARRAVSPGPAGRARQSLRVWVPDARHGEEAYS